MCVKNSVGCGKGGFCNGGGGCGKRNQNIPISKEWGIFSSAEEEREKKPMKDLEIQDLS
ncbi:hypothetical protein [Leptospira kobayashii]|uniref:hypothetical protein n=1 Tax=Leptospira kobayashii TaxID=1917830 RepID=UPI000D2A91DF|nr:hypothetical protein [Leptospira kobayashii]